MKRRILLPVCLALGLGAAEAAAQPPPFEGNRFLFVVETSATMKKLAESSRQTVFDMIVGGLNGQMQPGDTFGLWTYETEPHTGRFPMQVWHPTNALACASRAAVFLGGQKYAGKADTVALLFSVGSIKRAVGDLNVFILSDGSVPFSGTPFDSVINTQYKLMTQSRSQARKPFVTTLVIRGGRILDGYALIAGQPVSLPQLRTPTALAGRATPTAPTPTPTPAVAPKVKLISEIARSPTTTIAASTNLAASNSPAPRIVLAPRPVEEPPALKPVPAQSRDHTAPAVLTATAGIEPAPGFPPELPLANPPPASPPSVRFITGTNGAATTTDASAPPALAQPRPAATPPEPAAAHPGALPALLPEPLPVAARETPAHTAALAAVATPAVVASAKARGYLWIGLSVLGCAFGALVLAVYRARPVPQASYITRSMDPR